MVDKGTVAAEVTKRKKHRSPAYPAISLAQAIRRAEEFYRDEGKNPASFTAAATHWDYKPTSSGALLTAAALKSFGLVNELESSSGRTLQLSSLGLQIVADKRPESTDREEAIKEAALKPKIHSAIWRRWNGTLPSDAELTYRLENEWNFNTNSIAGFIKELRDTISFAKLEASDSVSEGDEDRIDSKEPPEVRIGDLVQWESQGILQFRELKRVKGFSDDREFVFVEGSTTGIPIAEVNVEGAAPNPPATAPLRAMMGSSGGSVTVKQDVFSLTEGEAVLSWPTPLSAESIADLKDWLRIVERKIARSEKSKPEAEDEGDA